MIAVGQADVDAVGNTDITLWEFETGIPELEIKIELRDEMVFGIQKRIIHNLEAIKQFLNFQSYDDICAGLYTYAVEEYGKILFL